MIPVSAASSTICIQQPTATIHRCSPRQEASTARNGRPCSAMPSSPFPPTPADCSIHLLAARLPARSSSSARPSAFRLSISLLPRATVAPVAFVVADDLDLFPDVLRDYLTYVRDPANGYVSVMLPIGDAMELSVRTK